MPQDRLKRILTLALPIMGGMLSQNIFNLVDTAMVGRLGNGALAAVGVGSFALFMCQALLMGVSSGVQAMAARRKGEGRRSETAVPLNGGLLIVVLVALPLSATLFFLVPDLFPYLNSDPEVVALGVSYMQWRILAMVMVGANFAFRGYWNAIDLSRIYLTTLLVMHASNILLNYTLIFGHFGAPALGVAGAAIGTALATAIGTACYLGFALARARENGFLKALPGGADLRSLVKVSLPSGVQQLFFASGFTAMYWIIGQVGTREMAAANILLNVILSGVLPALGLGVAAATLVGQALGRGEPRDAARWGWDVVRVGLVVLGVIAVPLVLLPDAILSVFIQDPETVALARLPMRISGSILLVEAVAMVLMNALVGAGDAKRVMTVSILTQWLGFLPLAYLVGPVLGWGLLAIWTANGLYRVSQAIIYALLWKDGRWAKIRL